MATPRLRRRSLSRRFSVYPGIRRTLSMCFVFQCVSAITATSLPWMLMSAASCSTAVALRTYSDGTLGRFDWALWSWQWSITADAFLTAIKTEWRLVPGGFAFGRLPITTGIGSWCVAECFAGPPVIGFQSERTPPKMTEWVWPVRNWQIHEVILGNRLRLGSLRKRMGCRGGSRN